MFALDHIREEHFKQKRGTNKLEFNYHNTEAGKTLAALVGKKGLNLKQDQWYIDYAFKRVPKVKARNRNKKAISYVPVTQKEARPLYDEFAARVIKDKPDVIVPMGNMSCKATIGKSEISKLRGVPRREIITSTLTKETHECWVLPTYSMEYLLFQPKITNLVVADMGILKKYVEEGYAAFMPKKVEYEDVTTIQRVREIFTKEIVNAPVVAWDLETNTLHPEKIGAKPLCISLSWREGQGVTIPLQHKCFTWNLGELAEIYKFIEEFVGSKQIKVGHNIKFDIKFLRLTRNITVFNNNRDTQVMYWLLVNQEVKDSLRLSDLTYEFTDVGGYDRELEEFKENFKKNALAEDKKRIDKLKDEWKEQCTLERAEANAKIKDLKEVVKVLKKQNTAYKKDMGTKEDNPTIMEQIGELLMKQQELKYVKPKMPDFGKPQSPRNEIDGSDFNYEWIPFFEMLSPYAAGDVDVCLRIYNALDKRAHDEGLTKKIDLYSNHYVELTNVLAKLEATGVQLDIPYVKHMAEIYTTEEQRLIELIRTYKMSKEVEAYKEELYQMGVEEFAKPKAERDPEVEKLRTKLMDPEKRKFNPASSDDKQRAWYLISGVELPFNREYLTDTALDNNITEHEAEWYHFKADKTAFEYIKDNYPEHKELAEIYLEYSLVKTRKQSFTYKFLEMVDANGRLHGRFNPTGTATSRLSSAGPNLQNLPRKSGDVTRFDYINPIKREFVTSFEGGALIQLDYSALESRILALDSGDYEMIKSFIEGADIHKETAALTFKKLIDDITDDERTKAKAVSFGVVYGEVPMSFAPKWDMTLEEAEQLFKDFFAGKPTVEAYIEGNKQFVRDHGYIETKQGFTRNLRDIFSKDKGKQNEALRQSNNTRVQGTGAFLTNSSVILINKIIEKLNLRSRIVMTVHDSIVIDCPPEEIKQMAKIGVHVMENLPIDWLYIDWEGERVRFPVTADAEIGITYNDMVDYDAEDLSTFATVKGYCDYHMKKKHLKNCKNCGKLTEEKYEEFINLMEANKNAYRKR